MVTVEFQVSQSDHDAKQDGTIVTLRDIDVVVGFFSTRKHCGFIFEDVIIPEGVTITDAYLTLNGSMTVGGGSHMQFDIYGEAIALPAAFQDKKNNITERVRTSNRTAYNYDGEDLYFGQWNTHSVLDIVNELMGLKSYNGTMCFLFIDSGFSTGLATWQITSYDNSPAKCAKLVIEYEFPVTSENFTDNIVTVISEKNNVLVNVESSDDLNTISSESNNIQTTIISTDDVSTSTDSDDIKTG